MFLDIIKITLHLTIISEKEKNNIFTYPEVFNPVVNCPFFYLNPASRAWA